MSTIPTAYEIIAAAICLELNDFVNWFIGLATGSTSILLLSRQIKPHIRLYPTELQYGPRLPSYIRSEDRQQVRTVHIRGAKLLA